MNIETTPRKYWDEYGLYTENIIINGKPTNFQGIYYKGEFINFMTHSYNVIPNEDVIKTTDAVAERLGLVKAKMKLKDKLWYDGKGNVIGNSKNSQVHIIYQLPEVATIKGSDTVRFQVGIWNSIDGAHALTAYPHTYREVCTNQMFHLGHEIVARTAMLDMAVENISKAQQQADIMRVHKRHSKNLDFVSVLEETMSNTMKMQEILLTRYREMYQVKLMEKTAQDIAKKFPKGVTKNLDWLKIDEKTKEVSVKGKVTEWDAFNDITDILSHGDASYKSTLEQYKLLDALVVRV